MIRAISLQDLAKLVEQRLTDPEMPGRPVQLFDLRAESAFLEGHVPHARHTPPSQAERWIPQRALTHDLVVLIDEDGAPFGPARELAAHLVHAWFRRLRFVEGGIKAYRAAGLPIETGGSTGDGAASAEGASKERLASSAVEWRTPDGSKTPRVI
jgi:rhodanese-related sulfurtransferase